MFTDCSIEQFDPASLHEASGAVVILAGFIGKLLSTFFGLNYRYGRSLLAMFGLLWRTVDRPQ
jgi:hypothetical protein